MEVSTADASNRPNYPYAVQYIKMVQDKFRDNIEVYNEFLGLMKLFNSPRLDKTILISMVKDLFKGHHDLIIGLSTFLPKMYEITFSKGEFPVQYKDAIAFVENVKNRFLTDTTVYSSFISVLNMYRKKKRSVKEIYYEVAILFHDHPDLFDEFTRFLPDDSPVAWGHTSAGSALICKEDKSSMIPSSVRHPDMNKKELAHCSEADHNLSVEHPEQEQDEQKRLAEKDTEHISKYFYNGGPCKRSKISKTGGYAQEFSFLVIVEEKLDNDTYQEFVKCLHLHSKDIISRNELKSLVGDIFANYPDLVEGFNEFLTSCENRGGFFAEIFDKGAKSAKTENREIERKHERDGRERDRERDGRKRGREREKDVSKKATSQKDPSSSNEKYNLRKPKSELDLSNTQRCTPSYKLLRDQYLISPASHSTELDKSVLNDGCVIVPPDNDDYSFKPHTNPYEESLFRCEDYRFELDMILESVNATIKRVEELIKMMQDGTIEPESRICVEEHFSVLNLRCIEKLYGDHGLVVMDVLQKNAHRALPIILTRLKQKQEECLRCRADFNEGWAEFYTKYHHKSLDHRSFHF